jgi:AraC-like DNA-binding protein
VNLLEWVSAPTLRGVATAPPGTGFGPRRMRGFELVWIAEGDAEYECDGTRTAAPESSVVLCRDGVVDAFRWDPRRPTRHVYLHFDLRPDPPGLPPPEAWPVVRALPDRDVVRPLLHHAVTWAQDGDPQLLRLTVAHLLLSVVSGQLGTRAMPRPVPPPPVAAAQAEVERRLREDPAAPIRLADLAGAAHVSPEHLCRVFATATGRSPMETVRLARLDRAAELLARSDLPVAAVAAAVGFRDPYHFSRRFRAAYGRSPTAVRRGVQAGELPPLARRLERFDAGELPG